MIRVPQAIALRPFMLRRAHLHVLVEVMGRVRDHLGEPAVLDAAESFYDRPFADRRALARYLVARDEHSQFYPWVLWDADTGAQRLGSRLLRRCLQGGGAEAQIARALLNTRGDVYQVIDCDHDIARLERVADGAEIAVEEPVLGNMSAPGELLVARILDLGDTWLLDAVHACLPGRARRGMVRAARRVRRLALHRRLPVLLAAATRALERIHHGQPLLVGPDGGDVVHSTLVFEIADRAAVHARLEDAVHTGVLARGDGRHTGTGQSFRPMVDRPGGRSAPRGLRPPTSGKTGLSRAFPHPPSLAARRVPRQGLGTVPVFVSSRIAGSDRSRYTITDGASGLVGVSLELGERRLQASTGCRELAEELRDRIERWLPGLRYRLTLHRDLDGLLLAGPRGEPDSGAVRRLAEQWLHEYLTAFPDRPQRSLGGITPRQATRTARGRTKVRGLLRSVQRFSDAVGASCEGALESILAELGAGG